MAVARAGMRAGARMFSATTSTTSTPGRRPRSGRSPDAAEPYPEGAGDRPRPGAATSAATVASAAPAAVTAAAVSAAVAAAAMSAAAQEVAG